MMRGDSKKIDYFQHMRLQIKPIMIMGNQMNLLNASGISEGSVKTVAKDTKARRKGLD